MVTMRQSNKQLTVLGFFSPPSLRRFQKKTGKIIFANLLSFVTQEARDQDLTCFLGHTDK